MGDDLEVSVDPGEIDQFASDMFEAADYWWDKEGAAYQLYHANDGDDIYPFMGKFAEADECIHAHHEKWKATATAFRELYALLEGLAEGSKNVAERYRNLEELNTADANALDGLLEPALQESMSDVPKSSDQNTEQDEQEK